jgi:hypothetical protein
MSDAEHDPEFEAFLKRRSPMHRRLSDFDHAEPSVDLDRLVLTRAREAIEVPPQASIYRATRWAMPLGIAATILIAFTLVLNIDRNAPTATANSQVASDERVASQASPTAAAAPSPELSRIAPAAPAPAAVAESSAYAKAEARESAADLSAMQRADAAPAIAADSAESPAQSSAGSSAGLRNQPEQYLAKKAEATLSANSARARAEALPTAPAETELGGDLGEVAVTGSQPGLTARASSPSSPARMATGAGASAPGAAPASAPPAPPADPRATAESWLQEINRLRAAGKNAEADRELVAFREAHPAHPGYSVAKPPAR